MISVRLIHLEKDSVNVQKKGEKVLLECKLEEIFKEGKDKKKYYRIILSDHVQDKMLLLGK